MKYNKIKYKFHLCMAVVIIIIINILIATAPLYAQLGDKPQFIEKNKETGKYEYTPSDFGMHIIGSIALENTFRESILTYTLGFSMHFDYLYIRAIFDLEKNNEMENYFRNWTSIRQYIAKLDQLSYGIYNKTNFYAYIGEIYDFTTYTGTLVKNYTNGVQSPLIKGMGGHLAFDIDNIRVEAMISDLIAPPELVATYGYIKPLFFINSNFYSQLIIGGSYAIDFSPFETSFYNRKNEPPINSFGDKPVIYDRWELPLNGDKPDITNITGWTGFINIPLYNFSFVNFFLLTEYATINGLGQGLRLGVNGNLLNYINYKIEFIMYESGFIPSLFFTQYNVYKANRYIQGIDNKGNDTEDNWGYYIEFGKDIIPNRLGFLISYEDYFGTGEWGGESTLRFYFKEIVNGLGIELLINNIDHDTESFGKFFEESFEKTMWYLKLYWWVTPNAEFSITTQKFLLLKESRMDRQQFFSIRTLIYL